MLFYIVYQMTTCNPIGLRKIRLRAFFLVYGDHKGEHGSKFHMVRSIIKRFQNMSWPHAGRK